MNWFRLLLPPRNPSLLDCVQPQIWSRLSLLRPTPARRMLLPLPQYGFGTELRAVTAAAKPGRLITKNAQLVRGPLQGNLIKGEDALAQIRIRNEYSCFQRNA